MNREVWRHDLERLPRTLSKKGVKKKKNLLVRFIKVANVAYLLRITSTCGHSSLLSVTLIIAYVNMSELAGVVKNISSEANIMPKIFSYAIEFFAYKCNFFAHES